MEVVWIAGILVYLYTNFPSERHLLGPGDFEKPIKFPESVQGSSAVKDLIKHLLIKDPKLRLAYNGGASEIKQHAYFRGMNWARLCYSNRPPNPPPPVIPGPFYCHHDDGVF